MRGLNFGFLGEMEIRLRREGRTGVNIIGDSMITQAKVV